ncbi:MAG: 1,2-phenylacetyl-CoA epoxidase subunit PaaC [Pseudomonadota bacterium]
MSTLTLSAPSPHLHYVLSLADDQLILGQRLSAWSGRGPTLEEDMALSNIALDHIGAARNLYSHASVLHAASGGHGDGTVATVLGEDDFAYRRAGPGFFNCLLVERPNGDFAHTIVRQVLFSVFALLQWQAMKASSDEMLSAIAGKSEKEARYHVRHSGDWLIRLGDGTAESRGRTQNALLALWPYVDELFQAPSDFDRLISDGVAPDPAQLKAPWQAMVGEALKGATLPFPDVTARHSGGRAGHHTEALEPLLGELQSVHRMYPGATW